MLFAQVKMCKGPIRRGKLQINGINALASRLLVVALPGERERGQGDVILLEWGGCGWRAV